MAKMQHLGGICGKFSRSAVAQNDQSATLQLCNFLCRRRGHDAHTKQPAVKLVIDAMSIIYREAVLLF
jgi:hypothetical protein